MKIKERAEKILKILRKNYEAKTALNYSNPLELLVATILSAQCTDERVNKVTKDLFKKYKSCSDYADADLEELQEDVRPTGFFRNKAKSIKSACQMIKKDFGGKVPDEMAKLLELPGVARKTANCVLSQAFNKNEGVVVDTHVKRLSKRLGLSKEKDPNKIEKDLMETFEKKDWSDISHLMIWHGRKICVSRKPKCPSCPLSDLCPSYQDFMKQFYD